MSRSLIAPSTITPGSKVILPDGSTTTVDANGVLTVSDQYATAFLAAGFSFQAASAGVSKSENSYIRTDAGTKTLLAAGLADRQVVIIVTVTTTFATGDGAQPTLAIGQTGSTSKFAATSKFVGATAGTTFAFAGTLSAATALIATLVAATGTTSTGAYTIDAIIVQ